MSFADVSPQEGFEAGLARASGAIVTAVRRGGQGERLSLRANDIVVGMNGQPVSDGADWAELLLATIDGAALRLTIWRGGRYRELRLP